MLVYIMYTIDTLDEDLDNELMNIYEWLSDLYSDVEKWGERWERKYHKKNYPDWSMQEWYYLDGRKDWEWIEIFSNGTEKRITYKNWKKDWPFIEEWKWVYRREWQYNGDFRVWQWVETRKNWSKIEGEYDDFGCQNGKWIKTDSEGNILKQWEYEHWVLKNGTRVEFSF